MFGGRNRNGGGHAVFMLIGIAFAVLAPISAALDGKAGKVKARSIGLSKVLKAAPDKLTAVKVYNLLFIKTAFKDSSGVLLSVKFS